MMPTDHTYADTDRMWLRDPGEPDDRLDSEDACLELIDRHFPTASGHFPHGRGDDCAELADLPGTLALSSDMFWQDSHFRTQYFIPAEAGAKALASSVSDLAAAGAVPLGFSLGLMLASGIGKKTLAGMLGGMSR